MLARAPAHEHRHPQASALAHGDVVVSATKLPTKIVTVDPGLACEFGAGFWSRTTFSWLGSFVCCFATFTLKPDCSRVDCAVSAERKPCHCDIGSKASPPGLGDRKSESRDAEDPRWENDRCGW